MAEQWRRFREKLRLCDPAPSSGLDGSEILPIVVGEATHWIRLDRLVSIARGMPGGTPAPAPAAAALPAGTIVAKVGPLPAGWLACDGSLVSRTAYARLFAALGESYGQGDGTTTFALPEIKAKLVAGNRPDAVWIIAA